MRKKKTSSIGNNGKTESIELLNQPLPDNGVHGTNVKAQTIAHAFDVVEKPDGQLDSRDLLLVLNEVRNGNFNVRMPIDQFGIHGKICDALNDIISFNERMMQEFTKAGNIIGKQGKLTQRIEIPNARGAWSTGIESLNSLISDLVHPTIEIAHVISSVAKGNFSQLMPQEIGGHELQGEFARIAKEVNDMVKQLKLIAINRSLEAEVNERRMSEEKVKALNLELLKNIDKLEAANKDLDRFAFMASHDLQEPLRKILTFSERLNTKYGEQIDEEAKRYLSRIRIATERLQILIKNIMTFAKISIEKSAFEKSDLNILVNEVVSDMDAAIKEKNATITIEPLPSLYVNPHLIRSLFYNLIHNALKYSKPDVLPEIKIYSDILSEGTNGTTGVDPYCRIFVEDNGIGFDQKYSEQIFEMFKRLHHQDEYEGTGIGLAFCKKIVEQHEGFISAKSEIGQGATFIVSLPTKQNAKKG